MLLLALSAALYLTTGTSSRIEGGATKQGAQRHQTPEQRYVSWLQDSGVQRRAVIATPAAGERGLYASKDIGKDHLIARIPMRAAYWFKEGEGRFEVMAEALARDALDAQSPHAPWLGALPMLHGPSGVVTRYTLPREYLPLVGSKLLRENIAAIQDHLQQFWREHGARLAKEGITLDRLKAAIVTISTRVFSFDYRGSSRMIFIPFIDMTNHRNDCENYWEFGRCDFFEKDEYYNNNVDMQFYGNASNMAIKDLCFFWRAGTDIKAGSEVCHYYGPLTPEKAFYTYGYNLPDPEPGLSHMDCAGYSTDHIEGALIHKVPNIVDGPLHELQNELKRVSKRIKALEALADKEAAMKVAPTDPGGSALRGMKVLRQQRLLALRREAERLRKRIEGAQVGGSSDGCEAGGTDAGPGRLETSMSSRDEL